MRNFITNILGKRLFITALFVLLAGLTVASYVFIFPSPTKEVPVSLRRETQFPVRLIKVSSTAGSNVLGASEVITSSFGDKVLDKVVPFVISVKDNFKSVEMPVFKAEAYMKNEELAKITTVKNSSGAKENVKVSVSNDGIYKKLTLGFDKSFKPGLYTLDLDLGDGKHIQQDFTWGVLAINTDKSNYSIGEAANLAFAVLDDKGEMVCDATLTLDVSFPSGESVELTTVDGSININPQCKSYKISLEPDYSARLPLKESGEYKLKLTATTANGVRFIEDSFLVSDTPPSISLIREAPTRIYPYNKYPVRLKFKSDSNFVGEVKDFVPSSFEVFPSADSSSKFNISDAGSGRKSITWQVSLDANEEVVLSYEFEAPKISPYFFLLGKAKASVLNDGEGEVIAEEGRFWQIAVDALGDIGVYRESTGGQALTTTVSNQTWDTTVVQGAAFTIDPGGSGRHIIDLADAGHYLVTYNVGWETSSGTYRSEQQGVINLAGSSLPYGRSSCYIRRTAGADECWTSGGAIINAASGDDLIIQAYRTDNNSAAGVARMSDESGLMLVKLEDSWDYARVQEAGGGQAFNSTTFSAVTFDTNDETSTGITHSTSSNTDRIILANAGHYLVTANVMFRNASGSARRNEEMRLTLNGTEIDGTRTSAYLRGSNSTQDHETAFSGIIETTSSNAILRVEGACEGEACGGITNVGGQTGITVAKLPDVAEYLRLHEATGGQDIDAIQDPITWDTNDEVDSASFSHSSNASTFTINRAGNYILFGSFYADRTSTTNGTRAYPHWDWRKGASTVIPYGSFGKFNRGNQSTTGTFSSGDSGAIVLDGLSSGDTIALLNTDETSGTTNTTGQFVGGRYAVQGVRVASLFPIPETTQLHYRLRDDSTALNTSGGWLASEDSDEATAIDRNTTRRIRLEVANTGTGAQTAAKTYELQWGRIQGGGSCSTIATWTGADNANDDIDLVDSTQITDGTSTSALLSNTESYSFVAGEGKDTSDTTSAIGPLGTSSYTELEYAIRPTNSAVTGATYCFRVVDTTSSTALDLYSVYPKITLSSQTVDVPALEWGSQSNVSDTAWTTINFTNRFVSPVFVCSVDYANNIGNESDGDADATVCRVQNVTATSVQVRLQEPGTTSGSLANAETVYWMVAEEGAYDTSDIKFEAFTYTSTVTDRSSSWVGQAQTYSQSYTNPVVFGQVMSYNDTNWSVFWAHDGSRNPPSSTSLYTGKHVGQDSNTTRANETIGVIVMEKKHGSLGSYTYDAGVSPTQVDRIDDTPPDNASLVSAFSTAPTIALVSQTGINGGDGPFPVVYGSSPFATNTVALAIDEDEIADGEMSGAREEVALLAFDSAGSYSSTRALDQLSYRIYQNTDSLQPSTALASENTSASNISRNDVIRLRMSVQVGERALKANESSFKLQYGQGSTCSSITSWTDVGGVSSDSVWRGYDNATPNDGDTITSSLLDGGSNVLESYEEENSSAYNPNAINVGQQGEWDFVVQHNGADAGRDYCFRMVQDNGSTFAYTRYPQLTTTSGITVSGTCTDFDEVTACPDGQTVRFAINGHLEAQTATTSSGTWTINYVNTPSSGDVITIFLDGVADANEANAVTKYDGAGNITGVKLIEEHLTIGSDDNQVLSNADLSSFDNSVSSDEDIFFDVDANNDLVVDSLSQSTQEELYILANNTYRPDSSSSGNITTFSIENNGTLTLDGNTLTIEGNGTPFTQNGTFNPDTSTVSYTNLSSANITALTYYNLDFSPTSGTPSCTLLSGAFTVNNLSIAGAGNASVDASINNPAIDVNGDFSIGLGDTFTASSSASFTIAGDFTNNGTFNANSGTVTFDDASKTSTLLYSAATSFYNFSMTTAGKTLQFDNVDETVILAGGSFVIQGTSCGSIDAVITSDDGVNQFELNIDSTATTNIDFADISFMNATGSAITADQSNDSGSNTNVTFANSCLPQKIVFTNASRTLTAGVCNGSANVFVAQLQNNEGTPRAPSANTVIRMSSNSPDYTVYSDDTCSTTATNGDFTYTNADSTKNVYIIDNRKSVPTWTLTASKQSGPETITDGTQDYTVDPGDVAYLVITLPGETFTDGVGNSGTADLNGANSGSNAIAGLSFDLVSVSATDVNYNVVDSYFGTKNFSWKNGTNYPANAPNGASPSYPASASFTNGQATLNLSVTLYDATLGDADPTIALAVDDSDDMGDFTLDSTEFSVEPDVINSYSVSVTTPQTAGTCFTGTNTITALDQYENVRTSDASTIDMTTTGQSINFYTDNTCTTTTTQYTLTSGSSNLYAMTTKKQSGFTITATRNGGTESGTSGLITVDPASANAILVVLPGQTFTDGTGVSGATNFSGLRSPDATAGIAFSVDLKAVDAYNNLVDSGTNNYTGSKTIDFSNSTAGNAPDATSPSFPSSPISFTNGEANGLSITYYNAATSRDVKADDTATPVGGTASTSFDVLASSVSKYGVVPASYTQTAGDAFNIDVIAWDDWENELGSLYTAPSGTYGWTTTASDAPDTTSPVIGTLVQSDFTNGTATKSVTLYKAESGVTFTATDPSSTVTGTSSGITVNHGDVSADSNDSYFVIVDNARAAQTVPLTITLRDTWRNPISGVPFNDITINATSTATITQPSSNTDSNGQATGSVSWSDEGIKTVTVGVGGSTSLVQDDGVSADADGLLDDTHDVDIKFKVQVHIEGGVNLNDGVNLAP